ncbi:TetR/AcrR family transcriptional regulator [Mammaliicoccus sciuri]|uniref:TetR/AcrR family transcriptional regulator n=1 Tax=Mammaliicoccus sciuri TaxID=1296 RepID=UPI002DB93F59|nr:TetR/AcrR family transcriptional regulator [Mammaliicoccus sciuri]MEB6342246.1 TetR/AcrR family transcriptional regulator [Mammaliicoccus sciuri]
MNNTSEKLIQISMRTFSEMGYYGTSLNNIANELGIKKASLYNYFNSKDELYEQCIERCMNIGMKLIESIDTQPHNAHEELLKFFQEYIYDSEYLVKFYIQLSFAPSNFKQMILENNKKLAIVFNSKLVDIHKNSEFNVNRDDFILFINMFVYGWLYRRSFIQNNVTPDKIIKEFDQHIKILTNQSNADNS